MIDEVTRNNQSVKVDSASGTGRAPVSNTEASGSPDELLRQIQSRYNLTIAVEGRVDRSYFSGGGAISGLPVLDEQLANMIPLLASELSVYSSEVLEAMNLRRILLARELTSSGIRVAGVCGWDTVYLNTELSSAHAARTIHHEFFHMLDRLGTGRQSDLEWAKLNPPEFEYTGVLPSEPYWTLYTAKVGFLTQYSTYSVSEDKAETYSLMIKFPERIKAHGLQDDIIANKVAHIRTRISTICAEIDDQFWKRIDARHESSPGCTLTVFVANNASDVEFDSGDSIDIKRSAFRELTASTNHDELDSLFRVSAESGEQPRHALKLEASESRYIIVTLGCKVNGLSIYAPFATEISTTCGLSPPFRMDLAVDGPNVYVVVCSE